MANRLLQLATNALQNFAPVKLLAGIDPKTVYGGGAQQQLADYQRGAALTIGKPATPLSDSFGYRGIGEFQRVGQATQNAAMGAIAETPIAVVPDPTDFIHITSASNADDILKNGFDATHNSYHLMGDRYIPSVKATGNALNVSNNPETVGIFKSITPNPVALQVTLDKGAKVAKMSGVELMDKAAHAFPDLFLHNQAEAMSKYATDVLKVDAVLSPDLMEGLSIYNLAKVVIKKLAQ